MTRMKALSRVIIIMWLILWAFFLIREDKDGQYASLKTIYTIPDSEKFRFILGANLYDFLLFCRSNIPDGATYNMEGFEKFSIDAVRARYFLYPLREVLENADFKIVYGKSPVSLDGYKIVKTFNDNGHIFKRLI